MKLVRVVSLTLLIFLGMAPPASGPAVMVLKRI